MFKWAFLIAVGLFVCYHFYPKETERNFHKLWDKSSRAVAELRK